MDPLPLARRALTDGDHAPATLLALATAFERHLDGLAANRLAELEDHLGRSPRLLIAALVAAADPAERRAAAAQLAAQGCGCGDTAPAPTAAQEDEAAELLARRAIAPVVYVLERGE